MAIDFAWNVDVEGKQRLDDLCDVHMNSFCQKNEQKKTEKTNKIIVIMRYDCLLYVNFS